MVGAKLGHGGLGSGAQGSSGAGVGGGGNVEWSGYCAVAARGGAVLLLRLLLSLLLLLQLGCGMNVPREYECDVKQQRIAMIFLMREAHRIADHGVIECSHGDQLVRQLRPGDHERADRIEQLVGQETFRRLTGDLRTRCVVELGEENRQQRERRSVCTQQRRSQVTAQSRQSVEGLRCMATTAEHISALTMSVRGGRLLLHVAREIGQSRRRIGWQCGAHCRGGECGELWRSELRSN